MKDEYRVDPAQQFDPADAAKPVTMNRHQRRAEAKRLEVATREAKKKTMAKMARVINSLGDGEVSIEGLKAKLEELKAIEVERAAKSET